MKAAIMHVNGGLFNMFNYIILENSKFRAHNQHCSFIPLMWITFPHIAMIFLLSPLPMME